MRKLFTVALAALFFAGCQKENEPQGPKYVTLDFESVPTASLAGPTAYGGNLYDGFGAGQYTGYTDAVTGLRVGINVGTDNKYNFWNGGIVPSQFTDMITAGLNNQCSVFNSSGAENSKTFAIAGVSGMTAGGTVVEFASDATEAQFSHVWVTNGTYAALSMRDGDAYAKEFGLGDWFKLTISATDKDGAATGTSVEFYLADFRTATSPGIVTEWTQVDLTALGDKVHKISFALSSSDNGDWGMNTPAYFCLDNLAFLKQ